jgi:hypothetical protein
MSYCLFRMPIQWHSDCGIERLWNYAAQSNDNLADWTNCAVPLGGNARSSKWGWTVDGTKRWTFIYVSCFLLTSVWRIVLQLCEIRSLRHSSLRLRSCYLVSGTGRRKTLVYHSELYHLYERLDDPKWNVRWSLSPTLSHHCLPKKLR